MALDPTLPKDDVFITEIARYIRETRQAIVNDREQYITAIPVEFGTEDYDAVFLDTVTNIFRRSKAGDPTRNKVHGIYEASSGAVKVSGYINNDAWTFTPGSTVYVSAAEYGDLTGTDTGLVAGIAISVDTLIIVSTISEKLQELEDAIAAVVVKNTEQDTAILLANNFTDEQKLRIDQLFADVNPMYDWMTNSIVQDKRNVSAKSSNFTAVKANIYRIQATGIVVTPPSGPVEKDWFTLIPEVDSETSPFTVDFGTQKFQGMSEQLIYDSTNSTTFIYLGASYGWTVLN